MQLGSGSNDSNLIQYFSYCRLKCRILVFEISELGAGRIQILMGGMPGRSKSVLIDARGFYGVRYYLQHFSLLLEFFSFQHIFRNEEFEWIGFMVY